MRLAVLATLVVVALALPAVACAQEEEGGGTLAPDARVVTGVVTDAETGEPLPAANLQVEGTYRGTITNREGRYTLRLPALPATVVVRYIGYADARRTLKAGDAARQDLALAPSAVEMDEVVVRPDGEDPAVAIMRQVIARKQAWRADLRTYRTDAYNRFTVANDTGIVTVVETQTKAFWTRDRGTREVQLARRQTANLGFEGALPAALFVTNLYDDNIDVGGHTLIGVTHPDALEHYAFTLDSVRVRGEQAVFDIRVAPANPRKTAFEGRISVLDEAFAMIEAELTPSEAFIFPRPIERYDATFRQQFSRFDGPYWLPVDFRSETRLSIRFSVLLQFPEIKIDQVSRLANYVVNEPVPDSLYAEDRGVVTKADSTARAALRALDPLDVEADTLGAGAASVPLSEAEARAYATIDSTMTLEKAFKPTGLLGRLVDFEASSGDDAVGGGRGKAPALSFDWDPRLWYNRVEAAHLGARGAVTFFGRVRLRGEGGYNLAADLTEPPVAAQAPAAAQAPVLATDGVVRWTYGGDAAALLGSERRTRLRASYRYGIDRRYDTPYYPRLTTTTTALLGGVDYNDYLGAERVRAELYRRFPDLRTGVTVGVRSERHFSVDAQTSYDLLGTARLQPLNAAVDEGFVRAANLTVVMGAQDDNTLGLTGQDRLVLTVERGVPGGPLPGDFAFTRLAATGELEVDTFYRRRFLPNTLYLRADAGALLGADPVRQRFGVVDASMRPYAPFGVLKTRADRPYEGQRHVAGYWEHTFRTLPFEFVGWRWAVERGWNVLVHGGHALTWVDAATRADNAAAVPGRAALTTPDGGHHEVGLGLSGLLGLFRVDVTTRLDAPGLVVSFGAARVF